MDEGSTSAKRDIPSHRISHACENCRAKRIRCSGDRPVCQPCQESNTPCVYGFARGDRRRSLLDALEEHTGSISSPVSSKKAKQLPPLKTDLDDDIDADGALSDENVDDADEHTTTESSITSPSQTTTQGSKPPTQKSKGKSRQLPGRRARISSACLECKKRRRKCTGDTPCQTCRTFQTECIYDRSQDRRSKAYFQRKLAQGVQEALQSDHPDNVLDLLKKSAEGDDEVAQSFQNALQLAGADQGFSPSSVLMPELSRTSTADTLAWSQRVNDAKSNSHVCHSFCGVGFPGHKNVDWYPSEARERQERRLQGPQHLILPHTIDDQSPLSLTYTNFIQGAQHMLGQGATLESILGPLDAEVDLLFRPREQPDHFSASTWACEVVRLASPIDLVTQLATVFLLARFMRWTLDPSQENFAHLPTLVKPTPYQQRIPHYASADLFPLPATRDCLIRGELRLPTAVESGGEGAGIKFTWPFDLSQAVERDPHTGVTKVSRLLAELASDASNWSSSRDFLERTPVAEGFLRVVDHQHDWAPMEAFFSE